MNSQNNENTSVDLEYPSSTRARSTVKSTPNSLNLGYSHSEFSLCAPLVGPIISQQCLPEPKDGDDVLAGEVVLSHTRLSFRTEQQKPRVYVDLDMCGPSGKGANVSLRGGEEDQGEGVERLLSRAANREQKNRQQRLTFGCPLSTCKAVLHSPNCLSHCLIEHPLISTLEMQLNVTATLGLGLPLVMGDCASQRSIGILLFESAWQTGNNLNLPPKNARWSRHLAVMGMLWKTSWDGQRNGPAVTQLYNLWFFCPQALSSLQILVSAESRVGNAAKQEVKQQLVATSSVPMLLDHRDMQRENALFMRLTHREMKLLTNDFTTDIDLKLTIHEEKRSSDPPQISCAPKLNPLNLQNLIKKKLKQMKDQAIAFNQANISKQIESPVQHNLVAVDDLQVVEPPAEAAHAPCQSLHDLTTRHELEQEEGSCQDSVLPVLEEVQSHLVHTEVQSLPVVVEAQPHSVVHKAQSLPVVEKAQTLPDLAKVQSLPVVHGQQSQPSEEEEHPVLPEVPQLKAVFEDFQSLASVETPSLPSVVEVTQPPKQAQEPSQPLAELSTLQFDEVHNLKSGNEDEKYQREVETASQSEEDKQSYVYQEDQEENDDFLLLEEIEDEYELDLEEEESQRGNGAKKDH
ncbi:uncharacterized protein LOC117903799 isoform X2 [Drosophila subobscura]|uniref:uncharacterized protein LOC117903799 isoform X2 n=1 Tax=Drosophila subobscura TaxID=7241 RepID=UPI00155A47FC|nr:uncharacterized protein LOC117903799 isoform X2 [Drosophila subobscura]